MRRLLALIALVTMVAAAFMVDPRPKPADTAQVDTSPKAADPAQIVLDGDGCPTQRTHPLHIGKDTPGELGVIAVTLCELPGIIIGEPPPGFGQARRLTHRVPELLAGLNQLPSRTEECGWRNEARLASRGERRSARKACAASEDDGFRQDE